MVSRAKKYGQLSVIYQFATSVQDVGLTSPTIKVFVLSITDPLSKMHFVFLG